VPSYQRPANIRALYTRYNDLLTATVMRDAAAVKELLADGKNPNVRQSDGVTPLMVAAGNGDGEIATLLLARGADANARAPGGGNALSFARARSQGEMIKLLERSGAR
jgi:ankyrin repeat protein